MIVQKYYLSGLKKRLCIIEIVCWLNYSKQKSPTLKNRGLKMRFMNGYYLLPPIADLLFCGISRFISSKSTGRSVGSPIKYLAK